jgi:hypothetical protein
MATKSLEERMAFYEKELKRLQRALDYAEVQNVFSLHEYYHFTPTEEVEMIFAKKQKDVSFGQNWGIWVGLESVKNYYKNQSKEELQRRLDIPNDIKYAGAGEMGFHMLTTPVIEVAEDGETAKGMWYTPGFMTMFNDKTGKWEATWMYEKYAVDFIKEDGSWKIWHFNVYTDFAAPYSKSWVEASETGAAGVPPSPDEPGGAVPGGSKPDLPPIGYKEYTTSRVMLPDFPKPPEPYRTFSETFSYGPTRDQLAKLNIKVNY